VPSDAREIAGALRKGPTFFAFSDNTRVVLTSNAWIGREAGKHFGLSLAPGAPIRNADWHLSTQHGARATMRLSFDAAPGAADATLSRCATDCASTSLRPDTDRSRTVWDIRPVISREGAQEVRLGVADSSGRGLLSANLPWPTP